VFFKAVGFARLDMAASALGVLASQCLDRRIADKQALIAEVDPSRMKPYRDMVKRTGNSPSPTHASN